MPVSDLEWAFLWEFTMPQMNKTDFAELNNIKANDVTITNDINQVNAKLVTIKNSLIAHYGEVHPDDKAGVVAMAQGLKDDLDAKSVELQTLITAAGG